MKVDAVEAHNRLLIAPVQSILVVEDDPLIAEAIALELTAENYCVSVVNNGRAAIATLIPDPIAVPINAPHYDLLILDLILPCIHGLDVCQRLRQAGQSIPILILSAKNSEADRVLGLEVGADDYLSKPFGMRELVARCRALLRRPQGPLLIAAETVLQFRCLKLYVQEHRVFMGDDELTLPPKEFRLLEAFMRSPQKVFGRAQLLQEIWGADYSAETKTVDVHVRWLREKIEADPSHPEYIITVRGFGYRLG